MSRSRFGHRRIGMRRLSKKLDLGAFGHAARGDVHEVGSAARDFGRSEALCRTQLCGRI